jgi:hypothetical protein
VFHFKDEKAGDPRDTVLYPDNDSDSGCERMASPLILKPLALANGKFVPLIVRLKTPALTGVDLRQGERSLPLPQPTVIRDPKLANLPTFTDAESFTKRLRAGGVPRLRQVPRLHGGDALMSHLIAISVGPVQEFIAAARRTRDLWFGSYLLSEISKAVAQSVQDHGGRLIFPHPRNRPDLR